MDIAKQNRFSLHEIKWCYDHGVKITGPERADYPQVFLNLPSRPPFLTYWGSPVWNSTSCISIVGSRRPSEMALCWLDDTLTQFLSILDVAVVSGGARGIDQKAHQMALRVGRPTVVFVPAGLMHLYPHNLREWVQPVIDGGGAVISPFLPDSPMKKHFFNQRNRLIAAMSKLTLVVEARRKSGTQLTAMHTRELGGTVAVMPTYPGESGMAGLDMLYDGAKLVRGPMDLLDALGFAKLINAED